MLWSWQPLDKRLAAETTSSKTIDQWMLNFSASNPLPHQKDASNYACESYWLPRLGDCPARKCRCVERLRRLAAASEERQSREPVARLCSPSIDFAAEHERGDSERALTTRKCSSMSRRAGRCSQCTGTHTRDSHIPQTVSSAQPTIASVLLNPPRSQRNRYVTGLQGNVKQTFNNTFQGQRIHLDPKDPKSLFRIRWDFDPNKGCHVNAEFFSTQLTTKIAFTKSGVQVVKTPGNQSSTEYDQTVHDYSTWLDYQTKPNTATETFTPQQRTGEATSAAQEATLTAMASKLAQRWKRQYAPAAAQGDWPVTN